MRSYISYSHYILFVDDEVRITDLLMKLYVKKYNILVANSVHDAIKLVDKNKIAVVVADFEMPEVNGIELLRYLKDKFPLIGRIMLTGNQDRKTLKQAINYGNVHNFLEKPINKSKLDAVIEFNLKSFITKSEEIQMIQSDIKDASAYRKIIKKNNINMDELIYSKKITSKKLEKICSDLFSFILNHYNQIQDFNNLKYHQISIRDTLRDAILLTVEFNFYNFEILFRLIDANIHLLNRNISRANKQIEKCKRLLYNIHDHVYYHEIGNSINHIEQNIKQKILFSKNNFVEIYNILKFLFTLDTNDIKVQLVNEKIEIGQLGYLIVLKNEMPVYCRIFSPRKKVNTDLISNFVVAMKIFSEDIFSVEGGLNTINHDLGVIILLNLNNDLVFIMTADTETFQLRNRLRRFANQVKHVFENLPPFEKVDDNDAIILKKIQDNFIF